MVTICAISLASPLNHIWLSGDAKEIVRTTYVRHDCKIIN